MQARTTWHTARLSPTAAGVILLAIWLGAAGVFLLWLVHTPHRLTSAADYAVAVARLSGLLAGYAVVVLIALLARVPVLERTAGADRLSRWHAQGGRYTIAAVVVHIASVTWGYARSARIPTVKQVALLIRSYPDVMLAAVGAGLLITVAISSARAVRRTVSYEFWYHAHLLTYVAVAAAFSHQIVDGTDFVYNRAARAAWVFLYAAVGLIVVYYRLVHPVADAIRCSLTVGDVAEEAGGAISIVVRGHDVSRLQAESGHFFRLRFLTRGLWRQSHPFSLSAAPTAEMLRFTVKLVGDYTRRLSALTPGTRVLAAGPFGALTAARRRQRRVLLIAGGIGITPLRALFESLPADPGELALIYRCRSLADVTFRTELAQLAQARGASLIFLAGRSGDVGGRLDTQSLLRMVPDLPAHDVFLCAPAPMCVAVTAALRAGGVPARNIHWESFELGGRSPIRARHTVAVSAALVGIAGLISVRSDLSTARTPALGHIRRAGPMPTRGAPTRRETASTTVTVVGSLQRTLYTNVQVAAVLRNGRLVDVRPLALPNLDARSRQLSAMAAPILRREAIAADSAKIDAVSGATYTSAAYAQSLQAALDSRR